MSESKPLLFTPIRFGRVEVKNRISISPMAQYCAKDGFATTWHVAHLGARAIGGAGMVAVEAAAVEARGRYTERCLGIYRDEHVHKLKEITEFIKELGSVPVIQLAHTGRKASREVPWLGNTPLPEGRAWEIIAPSPVPHPYEQQIIPKEATLQDIAEIRASYVKAAKRSLAAGFEIIELHFAFGNLVSSFLSPLANFRTDQYGGSFENRTRLAMEIIKDIQSVLPEGFPIFVRIACTEYVEGGWTLEDSVQLAKQFKNVGIALLDCSSVGNVNPKNVDWSMENHVEMAAHIQRESGIPTGATGGIISAKWAEQILQQNYATVIHIARASLDDPNWPMHAAYELGVLSEHFPPQYDIWIGTKRNYAGYNWRETSLASRNQTQLEQLANGKL